MLISHQMAIEPKIDLDAIANAEEEKAPPLPQPAVTTIVPNNRPAAGSGSPRGAGRRRRRSRGRCGSSAVWPARQRDRAFLALGCR